MREMKISKASLLTMWSIFTVASLWLMFFSVSAIESQNTERSIQLHFDPNNAIQHFQSVKIIATEDSDDSYAIIKKNGWLVWIETDYNFLMSGWDTDSNTIEQTVRTSTILWWKDNKILWWANEAILWWESNVVSGGESNSILWWKGNVVGQVSGSTVFWWEENKIKWNYSSIAWWEWNEVNGSYAAAVWNNNKVDWYNSISMWSGSKVSGKNSFLWTDGNSSDALRRDNVFVVKWKNGMVVNKNKAHSFAQLTIWGSLIIYSGDMTPQCKPQTKWVVKVINNGDKKCLCSCDGSWRNALHDGIMCPFLCSNTPPEVAMCDNDSGKWDCTTYTYTWTCKTWTVVQWKWAFFVSTEINWSTITNYINWSCQSDTWAVESCRTALVGEWCDNIHHEVNAKCEWDDPDENAYLWPESAVNLDSTYRKVLVPWGQRDSKRCAYVCNDNFYYTAEWCRECPNGYDSVTHGCLWQKDCDPITQDLYYDEEETEWRCEPKNQGYCTYIMGWKVKKYIRENWWWFSNSNINKYYDVAPYGENKQATCIDGVWYNDKFEKNSCKYKCNNDYYCKIRWTEGNFALCQKASCTWNTVYKNWTQSKYNTWWKAWAYVFDSIMTPEQIANYYEEWKIYNSGYYISNGKYNYNVSLTENDVNYIKEKLKSKVDITKTGEVVNYLRNLDKSKFDELFRSVGFQKCVYWCPKEDRFTGTIFENGVNVTYSDINYRCVDETQREILKEKSKNNYCNKNVKFIGFANKINHVDGSPKWENVDWTYVPWNEFGNSQIPCRWTCAPGYELLVNTDYAPRNNSYVFVNGNARTNLFTKWSDWSTTYYTCYKSCDSDKYLSSHDYVLSCNTCSSNSALAWLQTWSVNNLSVQEYRWCTCPYSGDGRSSYWWSNNVCHCYDGFTRDKNTASCKCKGDTTLVGMNKCACLWNAIINKNYECSCVVWEKYEKWTGCVCDTYNKYFRDENKGKCVSLAGCAKWYEECKWNCYDVKESQVMDPENCNVSEKEYILNLKIQKSNKPSSSIYYKKWDKVDFNITVSYSGWNIAIGGFNILVSYESGNIVKGIKSYNNVKWLSWVNESMIYTWAYSLTDSDFNGLSVGQTWEFRIWVKLLSGGVSDFIYGNWVGISDSFSVIMQW